METAFSTTICLTMAMSADTLLDSLSLVSMLAVAAASGLIGSFALMKKMTLASDAISHIALPGLGLALLVNIHPLIGGGAALFLGAILVWLIERKTRISTETVIGVVFSASLAIGSLLTPEEELLEALFGDFSSVGIIQGAAGILAGLAIIWISLSLRHRFTLALVSPDLGKTLGLNVERLHLIFLLLFTATVLLGLQFLGILLMGSLIIIPAATAKNIAASLNADFLLSILFALAAAGAGRFLAGRLGAPIGPTIVSVAAALFLASVFLRRKE